METKVTKKQKGLESLILARRKLLLMILVVIYLVFATHEMSPYFQKESSLADIKKTQDFINFRLQTFKQATEEDITIRNTLLPASQFVNADVYISIEGKKSKENIASLSLRADKIILYTGIWVIIVLSAWTIQKSYNQTSEVELKQKNDGRASATLKSNFGETPSAVLEREVLSAEKRSEELYFRSTLLLTGGIVMAFIGVVVFYVSLPDPKYTSEPQASSYIVSAVRSTAILIFIEAIAWFLLRQYRSLVEDFKTFHKMYLKRANYLISIKILEKQASPGAELAVVMSLLSEDFTGRLKNGETTESLEMHKTPDQNPIFSLISNVADTLKKESKNEAKE
jgi:hypothetical protein